MKYILIILIIGFTLGCKAQTVVNLDGSVEANHYLKDLNNVRVNFVGTWQYINGNQDFVLHIYRDNMNPSSYWGETLWKDNIIGNYIYKENGVEIINTTTYMPDLSNINHTPFYGHTIDGISTIIGFTSIRDYGKPYLNYDCELRHKKGQVSMIITNIGSSYPLQATFKILPTLHTTRFINPSCTDINDYEGFSIPTEIVLTKISNTPPSIN